MDKITVRSAVYEDAHPIATLHIATWQVAYRGQIPDDYLDSLSLESRFRNWQSRLETQSAPRLTFVAERTGEIVGFASVGKCRDEDAAPTIGELYALYVAPQAMNQGVGSALITRGQEQLKASGFANATLWVLESNQHARRFYESKGWAADGMTRIEEVGGLAIPEMRYAILLNTQSKS